MAATPLKSFIYSCLNRRFLRFGRVTSAMFRDYEYSASEAADLARLCADVQRDGYEFIEANLGDEKFALLFNTATEYGVFVDEAIWESYLGMYVAGQMLTQPFASDGYCKELVHSVVYQRASYETQQAVCFLMLLATFVPDKARTPCDGDYYERCCADLQRLNLEQLNPLVAMRVLSKGSGT